MNLIKNPEGEINIDDLLEGITDSIEPRKKPPKTYAIRGLSEGIYLGLKILAMRKIWQRRIL